MNPAPRRKVHHLHHLHAEKAPGLAALAAAALLASCAAVPVGPAQQPVSDAREWIYGADAAGPRLMYGTPQSDDVVIAFACTGSEVSIMVPGADPAESGVLLASGGRRAAFPGTTEPDQLNGGVIITSRAPLRSPVLEAFSRTGDLSLGGSDGRLVRLSSAPHTRPQIGRFFAACG